MVVEASQFVLMGGCWGPENCRGRGFRCRGLSRERGFGCDHGHLGHDHGRGRGHGHGVAVILAMLQDVTLEVVVFLNVAAYAVILEILDMTVEVAVVLVVVMEVDMDLIVALATDLDVELAVPGRGPWVSSFWFCVSCPQPCLHNVCACPTHPA